MSIETLIIGQDHVMAHALVRLADRIIPLARTCGHCKETGRPVPPTEQADSNLTSVVLDLSHDRAQMDRLKVMWSSVDVRHASSVEELMRGLALHVQKNSTLGD